MDIVNAYEHVTVVTKCLNDVRADVDWYNKKWLQEATKLAQEVRVEPSFPRTVSRIQHRTNCPAQSTEEYYKRNLAIPLLDHFLSEFSDRFSDNSQRAAQILHLIPKVICSKGGIDMPQLNESVALYAYDLPSPHSLNAEAHMWQVKWLEMFLILPLRLLRKQTFSFFLIILFTPFCEFFARWQ